MYEARCFVENNDVYGHLRKRRYNIITGEHQAYICALDKEARQGMVFSVLLSALQYEREINVLYVLWEEFQWSWMCF